MDINTNSTCLECKRFVKCKNDEKSFGYCCDRFKPMDSIDIKSFQKSNTSIDPFKFDPSKEESNDIWSLLEDISKDNFVPKNLKIDDGDIPQASNFFTFTTDPRFLNVTPYAKQIEIGSEYFNEICSRCSDKHWLKHGFPVDATYEEIKEHIQFFEFGKCPKCGRRKSVQIRKGKLKPYVQMAVLAGQRAGKSATFDMMESYHTHWSLKYPNLIQKYGLLPSSQLHKTYTALTIAQVKQSVYDTLYGYLTTSPWFRSYNEMLDYYGTKYGEQLYTIKDTFFRYRNINMLGYVATPDIRALRGSTRCSAAVDELGWFMANQSGSVKYDADELHKAILNSFRTIHTATKNLYKQGEDNVLNPLFGNISSPSSTNDKIMRLYEQSKTSKYIYGKRYTTWEFNPTYTREDFSDDEQNNPVGFMRDYMCIPPSSSNPYVAELDTVKDCFSNTKNAFDLRHHLFTTKSGKEMCSGLLTTNWIDNGTSKILAIDGGRVNNSFALALGHFDTQLNKPVFDCLNEIIPDKTTPINFTKVCKDILYNIIDLYNVKIVVADRWNSAKLLDDIESDKGIQTETYSVRYEDFSSLKESLLNEGIVLPKLEKPITDINTMVTGYPQCERGYPMCHFALQLITVQDYGVKTVEKGDRFTDDIFRATVLAYSYLIDKDYKQLFSGVSVKKSLGGLGSRGGMGMSSNSNIGSRPTGFSTNSGLGSRG